MSQVTTQEVLVSHYQATQSRKDDEARMYTVYTTMRMQCWCGRQVTNFFNGQGWCDEHNPLRPKQEKPMTKMRVESNRRGEWCLIIPQRTIGCEWCLQFGYADAADRLRADLNAIAPGCVEMPPSPPLTVAEADKAYVEAVLSGLAAGEARTEMLERCRKARKV